MKAICLSVVFALFASSVAAVENEDPPKPQPKPYIDNRSEATELVRSLYNAIDRREFARAWSYFGDNKPAKNITEFAQPFRDASRVELTVGKITTKKETEGTKYLVPTSIVVKSKNADKYKDPISPKDPDEKEFSGCITVQLPKPKSEDVAFTPMQIAQADLKLSQSGQAPNCGDTADPATIVRARIIKAFTTSYADGCMTLWPDAEDDAATPETIELNYRYSYSKPEDPDEHATLYHFTCGWGAYNSEEIFYLAREDSFDQLQFPHPEYTVEYGDPVNPEDGNSPGVPRIAKSITVTGYSSDAILSNTDFDPDTQTLTFLSKWQGNGDTSTRGTYVFREGRFFLVKYLVDATGDDEVKPLTVIDFTAAR